MHLLLQAFVVPDVAILLDKTGVSELRLTHVVIPTAFRSLNLLRNSKVDPVTGSVNIKLLYITPNFLIGRAQQHMHMSCLDLTLPQPASTLDVLPISIRSQHLFDSWWTTVRYTTSDNGYVRELLLTNLAPYSFVIDVRKSSIDASGEECAIVITNSWPVDLVRESDAVAFASGGNGRSCLICHGAVEI